MQDREIGARKTDADLGSGVSSGLAVVGAGSHGGGGGGGGLGGRARGGVVQHE